MLQEQIALQLRAGEKVHEEFGLGVKFEHFLVKTSDLTAVGYHEENGISSFLEYLIQNSNWEGIYEEDYLIGAAKAPAAVMLKPGGQIVFSVAKNFNLRAIEKAYLDFLKSLLPELESRGQMLLSIGYQPRTAEKDLEIIPMALAKILTEYYAQDKAASRLLKCSAKTIVSIDYAHSDDFEKKMYVAEILAPIFTAMLDNVPMVDSAVYSPYCAAQALRNEVNSSLFHLNEIVTGNQYKYNEYAGYIAKNPVIAKADGDGIVAVDAAADEVYVGEVAPQDALAVMNMAQSAIRVTEDGIELAMVDALPYPLNMAFVGLVKGLFYNVEHLDDIIESFKDLRQDKIDQLKKDIVEKGLEAPFNEGTLREFAKDIFFMVAPTMEPAEQHYIQPLDAVLFKNIVPKQVAARQLSK